MSDHPVADEPPELRLASLSVLYRTLVRDQTALVDFVAVKLAHLLPDAVDVRRRGLLGRGPIDKVCVTLGDVAHELSVRHGALEATRGALVGGVVLQHENIPVHDWIGSLLARLEKWAADSDAARAALEQLS